MLVAVFEAVVEAAVTDPVVEVVADRVEVLRLVVPVPVEVLVAVALEPVRQLTASGTTTPLSLHNNFA